MKKLKVTKIIASMLVAALMIGLNPISASAAWRLDLHGWWNTEGDSYSTGWRQIDSNWYYFNDDGYMAHDTIVNGYYLTNGGSWSNGENEINAYINLLNDTNWQKENGIKGSIDRNVVLDINQDGVCEMLVHHGTCDEDKTTSVITYNNGKIKIEHLDNDHGGYWGYSRSEKVFFIGGINSGYSYIIGYKLENNTCKKVYAEGDDAARAEAGKATYIVNGQNVSKTEFDDSLAKFGEIEY